MSRRTAAALVAILIVSCGVVAGVPPDPAGPNAPSSGASSDKELQARIEKLVAQLGDVDFDKREAAQKELIEIGQPARAQVADAAKNQRGKISVFAMGVLRELDMARVTLLLADGDGKPLEGKQATITVNRTYSESKQAPIVKEISKGGIVELEKLAPNDYAVAIEVKGFCTRVLETIFDGGKLTYKIVLIEGGTIKGRIVDVMDNNNPVAGMTVRVYGSENRDEKGYYPVPSGEIVTNENGEFTAEHVPPGSAYIWFHHPKIIYRFPKGETGIVAVEEGKTAEVTIKAIDERWLHGKVEAIIRTPDGKLFNGDIAFGFDWPPSQFADFSRVTNGAMQFGDMYIDKHDIVIYAKGYAIYRVKGVEIIGNEINKLPDITLAGAAHLKVAVLGDDGKPLMGATVIVSDMNDPKQKIDISSYERRRSTYHLLYALTTDKDGLVECDYLPEGKYAVRAYTNDYDVSDETVVDVKPGALTNAVIDFTKTTTLALRVSIKYDGSGIWNRHATLLSAYTGIQDSESSEHIAIGPKAFKSDSEGRLLLHSPVVGDTVILRFPGCEPTEYKITEIPQGKTTEVKVDIKPLGMGSLKVTITPGNGMKMEDIGWVTVSTRLIDLDHDRLLSDPHSEQNARLKDGIAEVKDMYAGLYYMRIVDKKQRLLAVYRVTVEKDKTTELKITLPGLGSVEGVMHDTDGNPLRNMTVCMTTDSRTGGSSMQYSNFYAPKVWPDATTDENGRFKFEGAIEGPYLLYATHSVGRYNNVDFKRVTVKQGETVHVDYELHKERQVVVVLQLPKGETVKSVPYVSLADVGTNGSFIMLQVRQNPLFQAGDSKPIWTIVAPLGKYRLLIGTGYQGIVRDIEITAETKRIVIDGTFAPGKGTIAGKVNPAYSLSYMVAVGEKYISTTLVWLDGSFKFENLQPDKYRIFVESLDDLCINGDKYAPAKEVTVEEGKNVEGVTIP